MYLPFGSKIIQAESEPTFCQLYSSLQSSPVDSVSNGFRTTPDDLDDSERLRRTPVDSGWFRMTLKDSWHKQLLRTIPDDSERFRIMMGRPTFRSQFRSYRSRIVAFFTHHYKEQRMHRIVPSVPCSMHKIQRIQRLSTVISNVCFAREQWFYHTHNCLFFSNR